MNKIPFLVLSTDRYSDLWENFFSCFEKNVGLDQKIYFGSNLKPFSNPNVISVLSGEDLNWSLSLRKILDQIHEEYLVIILEDLFFSEKVDKNQWNDAITFCINNKVNYFRYFFFKDHQLVKTNSICSNLDLRIPYRATVCGIWKKTMLQSLLLNGESPWEFEIMASYRARDIDGFYVTNKPLFKCKNIVEKGMWVAKSVKWAEKKNIRLDLKSRKFPSFFDIIKINLKKFIFEVMIKIPWKKRVYLINLLKRILVTY